MFSLPFLFPLPFLVGSSNRSERESPTAATIEEFSHPAKQLRRVFPSVSLIDNDLSLSAWPGHRAIQLLFPVGLGFFKRDRNSRAVIRPPSIGRPKSVGLPSKKKLGHESLAKQLDLSIDLEISSPYS